MSGVSDRAKSHNRVDAWRHIIAIILTAGCASACFRFSDEPEWVDSDTTMNAATSRGGVDGHSDSGEHESASTSEGSTDDGTTHGATTEATEDGDSSSTGDASGPPTECSDLDTLIATADCVGIRIGAAINAFAVEEDPRYVETFLREFGSMTHENELKWGSVQPTSDSWNYGPADTLVELAEQRGMFIKGHVLVWHRQLPDWVSEPMTADDLRAAMRANMEMTMHRYADRIDAWDVVNEAFEEDGTRRNTIFQRLLGDGYIAEAFRMAHETDPDALLYYNDFNIETAGWKSDAAYALAVDLVAAAIPIDGVGMQLHIDGDSYPDYYSPEDFRTNIRRFGELGLTVNISEFDVRVRDVPGTLEQKLELQRQIYFEFVSVCVSEPACDAITFWGFTDKYSWVDNTFGEDDPLLYSETYAPKPALDGVMEALRTSFQP